MFLTFRGSTAFSGFRINKVLSLIQTAAPAVRSLHAEFIHFAKLDGKLDTEEKARLENLLHYGQIHPETKADGKLLLIIPRPGMISPWSSKATDIAHNCGLDKIIRLERGIAWYLATENDAATTVDVIDNIKPLIHDRMTETVMFDLDQAESLFQETKPAKLTSIDIMQNGQEALTNANTEMGLALSDEEITYLLENFRALNRNPTDVELMMFAQANSEHCRHKIFNAAWVIEKQKMEKSLFDMIRET
ncbi:MAG: phosphoribosylformylglycinamidine synthase, partial [Gammaproteobacteria bacterium]